jgi:hypothetical protein
MKKPKTWKERLTKSALEGKELHHRALCNYYHSRNQSAEFEAYEYEGRFGSGVVVLEPDRVHHAAVVVYYISV